MDYYEICNVDALVKSHKIRNRWLSYLLKIPF